MKLLFARRDFLDVGDGINSFLYAVIEALLEMGDEIHLVGPTPVNMESIRSRFPCRYYPVFHHVKESRPPGWWSDTKAWAQSWPRIVAEIKPDAIVLNGVIPCYNKISTLAINHDLQPRGGSLFSRIVRIIGYRLAHARAATCSELRNALASNILMPASKIDIISTCVKYNDFSPYAKSKKKNYLLHIGTMPYKHPEKSMAALGLSKNKDTRLLITGPKCFWVDEALAKLPLELQKRIELLGVISAGELRTFMAEARAVLVPSGYDIPVLSPTVLESFAVGATVVCTRSISRDLLNPGKNCLVAENPEDVALHLNDLISNNGMNDRLGSQALLDARSFDASKVALHLREVLQRVIATSSSSR